MLAHDVEGRGIAHPLVERRRALQVGEEQRHLADARLVAGPQGRGSKEIAKDLQRDHLGRGQRLARPDFAEAEAGDHVLEVGGEVDVAGVADYAMYYEDPYHGSWTASRIGTPAEHPDVYANASPVSHIDRLARPLLVLHGTSDVNVPYLHSVRLLDEGARHDVSEFANASASARRRDAKTITVTSDGDGSREMVVSYTVASPIWKTTYRVVLDSAGKPYFQGWAIVDNVSDEDWSAVSLSLVSGTPVSFIQPIQQPMYRYRPVIAIPSDLRLEPQVYEASQGVAGGV